MPGKRIRVLPGSDFRLTTATLGEELADEKGRTTIKLYRISYPDDSDEDEEDEKDEDEEPVFEKDPIIIGHLIAGRVSEGDFPGVRQDASVTNQTTPPQVETQVLDLIFTDDEPVEFEITGKK